MAARIVRFLLLCITSVELVAAQQDADSLRFLIEPSDVVVASGKPAAFPCVVGIFDKNVSITWLKNDIEIEPIRGQRVVYPNGTLAFHKVRKKNKGGGLSSDVGVYQCLAKTSIGALLSRPANLRIAEISPFHKQPENITAYEGEIVRLSCHLNSTPTAEIKWTFLDQPIDDIVEASKRYDSSIPGVLYIRDVRISDSGEYRCTAKNPLLSKPELSAPGFLLVNPGKRTPSNSTVFISPEYSLGKTVPENDLLVLECAVGESVNARTSWFYKKSENASEVFLEKSSYPYSILERPEISADDDGVYTCVVTHSDSSQNVNRSIYVSVATPPFIEMEPTSQVLPLALSTRFTCTAHGYPQPVISWLHNGKPLKKEARHSISENELILTSTVKRDAGIYQCTATNSYGFASAAGQLLIDDSLKPPSPIRVRCKPLNSATIRISWEMTGGGESGRPPPPDLIDQEDDEDDAAEDDAEGIDFGKINNDDRKDNSQIAGYTISYYKTAGGPESILPAPGQSYDVGNLDAGENYTFYIRTYSVLLGSEPSEKIVCSTLAKDPISTLPSKTRSRPLPPLNFEPEETDMTIRGGPPLQSSNELTLDTFKTNDTTVQVSWNFEKPNIPNDEYKMILKKKDGTMVNSTRVDFEDRKILFYNLDPMATYQVFMKILINGTEGEITSKFVGPSMSLTPLQPPKNVQISYKSATSLGLTWDPPDDEVSISRYIVRYSKLTNNKVKPIMTEESKSTEIMLRDLPPHSVFSMEIQAWDVNNRSSRFTDAILDWTLGVVDPNAITETKIPNVKDIILQTLDSKDVRVSWSDPDEEADLSNLYYVSYRSLDNPEVAVLNATRDANKNFVDMQGLSEGMTYAVQIFSRRDSRSPVGETQFIHHVEERKTSPEKSTEKVEIFGIRLTQDQLIGVYIGIGISVILIILCVIIICVYKRKMDKHYRQVANGPHFKPSNEKEMKVLTRNTNGYRGQMGNGFNHTRNVQLPLLTPNTSNGLNQIPLAHANRKVIEEEADKLLNNTTNSSVVDETITSTLDTTNDRDHEGGDSGYCDRNPVHSPLNKENSSENTQRSRKCSDVTVDDGFYDGEVASGVHGQSPGKLSTVV